MVVASQQLADRPGDLVEHLHLALLVPGDRGTVLLRLAVRGGMVTDTPNRPGLPADRDRFGGRARRRSLDGAGIETLHRMTPLALDGLAIGSYLAWVVRTHPIRKNQLVRLSLPTFIVSAIVIYGFGKVNIPFAAVMVIGRAVVSIGGGARLDGDRRPRSRRPVPFLAAPRVLGKYCYGLYLLHPIVVVKAITKTHWLAVRVPRALLPVAWIACLVGGLAASLALAWISWRFIESPCLSLKRFFPYRPAPRVDSHRPHIGLTHAEKSRENIESCLAERCRRFGGVTRWKRGEWGLRPQDER